MRIIKKNRLNKIGLLLISQFLSQQTMAAETLEQAFIAAMANNQRIIAAQADSQAAEQQLFAAQGQRHPQLNISTGYTQLSETPSANAAIGGQTTQFATAQAGSLKAQAMVSLPLFTSGRISHNIDAAEAIKRATKQNKKTTALNIKWQVASAFIAVFRAEKSLEVADSHVLSLKSHAKDVQNQYQQGMVARNDLLASQVELSNAEQQVLQKQNQLDIAQAKFNQLLNRDLMAEVNLLEQFPELPPGSLSELNQQALTQRPELKVLSEQVGALEHQASSETANLLPQVNISGGYQYEENKYTAYENMWVANATLNWTLYDGSTRHRSYAAKQQSLALKMQRSDLIGQIKLQIRQAWLDVQETAKRVQVATQAISQADENLKVSTERYQQGLANNTEVLDAEDLRIQAKNNLNNAQYDVVMAKLSLRRALGVL
jgi:outer membrane protein TolC